MDDSFFASNFVLVKIFVLVCLDLVQSKFQFKFFVMSETFCVLIDFNFFCFNLISSVSVWILKDLL